MANSIVRTDKWLLEPTPGQLEHLRLTQKFYRLFVRALIGVVYTHYRDIVDADSPCAAVEKLIHKTKSNPKPRYTYFDARFYKFPSYLRRAAIEAAIGQGSSFVTRYYIWQSGIRNRRDARPPRLNADTNICAVLYKGQCIKFSDDLTRAEIKVFNGSDWVWSDITIKTKRERHLIDGNKQLLPSLVLDRSRAYLALPFQVPCRKQKHTDKVVAVDLGINTSATARVVCADGTVTARKFIHSAADIDRRDKRLKTISHLARLTIGKTGKLCRGFCKSLYRKAHNINLDIAQKISRQIINWAVAQGATVIVFSDAAGNRRVERSAPILSSAFTVGCIGGWSS